MGEEQLQILKMLEDGQIGAEEAAELLAALSPEAAEERPRAPYGRDLEQEGLEEPAMGMAVRSTSEIPTVGAGSGAPGWEEPPARWSRFWVYPALAGGGLLIVGAMVLGLLYAAGAAPGWRVCGWLPMILGLVVAILAWWSRTARWLHLRVSEQGKRKVAFSFPLPLTLTAWVVRIAQRFVPQLKETGVDEMILALRDMNQDEPFFMDVEDDEDGEHVQIYVG
jgi:hypothetical protein